MCPKPTTVGKVQGKLQIKTLLNVNILGVQQSVQNHKLNRGRSLNRFSIVNLANVLLAFALSSNYYCGKR